MITARAGYERRGLGFRAGESAEARVLAYAKNRRSSLSPDEKVHLRRVVAIIEVERERKG